LRAQVEAMKISVGEYERAIKRTEEQFARERSTSAAATSELADARSKLEGLNARTAELEKHLAAQTETARKTEGDLRSELATVTSGAADKFKSEIDQLQAKLAAAAFERANFQAEIAKLQQEAESTTFVRDRVNTVAAEVARLTAALEGPDSPTATLIAHGAGDGGHGANGSGGGKAGSTGEQKGTLADRIRALQASTSRQV
jgi:chromosome segregation ATPase